jgi:hypothetical protein
VKKLKDVLYNKLIDARKKKVARSIQNACSMEAVDEFCAEATPSKPRCGRTGLRPIRHICSNFEQFGSLAAVVARSHALDIKKPAVEIRQVVEPDLKSNIGNLFEKFNCLNKSLSNNTINYVIFKYFDLVRTNSFIVEKSLKI